MRKNLLTFLFLVLCPWLVAQQTLSNDAVIKLVKAGLSDDLIVTTIHASPGNYDTSANGLIALKTAGASDKVIAAIVEKAAGGGTASTPAAAAEPGNALPAGMDDVGVYYKGKNGIWQSIMPEVVNFKTGGVFKSFASMGVVKGDINGHLQGARSKLELTYPVVLAIYLPEGVAVTEYQLLRLRSNTDSREFRSVTGGVLHVSGGATRDLIEFHAEKLAPRVYRITLDASMGKGEFGILPPGAIGSSNLGSSGKMYSISIIE